MLHECYHPGHCWWMLPYLVMLMGVIIVGNAVQKAIAMDGKILLYYLTCYGHGLESYVMHYHGYCGPITVIGNALP